MRAAPRCLVMSAALVGLTGAGQALAEPVPLAAGEYPPLTGESEPGGGLLSRVVLAAYATQGDGVRVTYLPWQRGFNETRSGFYTGTYPYVKNAEREAEFLYSAPLFADHIRLFGLQATELPVQWAHKAVCVPLGHSLQQIQSFVTMRFARLERPATVGHCFQLLQLGRVHAVWASETVAEQVTRQLRATGLRYKPLQEEVDYSVEYYLIVPKVHPDAAGVIQRFNSGLTHIRKSGVYKKIMGALVP
ncbi:MAG: hypothetical protein CFE44_07725 [Burkholderiales bacterium PBB4]|nr:MAG: hypothetical protein CFE44_07725 [Burkholderiales bacterium PBB4]